GAAGVDIGGGLEVDIDVARPAALVGLTVELPVTGRVERLPRTVRRRLDALLGPERVADLSEIVREALVRLDHVQRPLVGRGAPGGVASALHRTVLAHAAACAAGAPRLVRAAALLEAVVAGDEVGRLVDGSFGVDHARVAADLLTDLAVEGALALPDRATADRLAATLRRAGQVAAGPAGPALAALAAEVGDRARVLAPPSGRDAVAAADGAGHEVAAPCPEVPVDSRSLPGDLAEAEVAGRATGPSEVEVRIGGWAERRFGLWARAFDAADDTIVGLAPFRRRGRDAIARMIVPADAMRRLEVDVTDRAEMPRPSPALAGVQRAIHLGVTAARAERLGDLRHAAHRWRQCARTWDGVGDPVRGEQALSYARQVTAPTPHTSGRVIAPLLSDLVGRPARYAT
ncbi:MAG: hypothetical protein JXA83_00540, partial [Acidimicrobiales bacterium]|nr:hypothetical protein [Acidimicrobiales bacterium]